MNTNGGLLSDIQMQQFLEDGYIIIRLDESDWFPKNIRGQMDDLLAEEPNPGNNLLPRIPELARVFENKAVAGALKSILGPDYQMEDHRFPHVNKPRSKQQNVHKDGALRGDHRTRKVFGFYYPQDTPESHGPTGVLPGSQYFNQFPNKIPILPLTADASVVIIAHYEIWHLATANCENRSRYMMKFQFTRMADPEEPTWDLKNREWATDRRLLKSMWRWHLGGEAPEVTASTGVGLDRDGLLLELRDPSEATRNEAAYRLADLSNVKDKDLIIKALVDDLTGAVPEVAQSAVYGLAAIGVPAVDRLIPLLGSENNVAGLVAHALSEMGTAAAGAESNLRKMLENDDPVIRRRVAEALGNCQGGENNLTVRALTQLFNDPERRVQSAAAASVVQLAASLGPEVSSDLIGKLKAALFNENRYVRGLAARALERIGTPETLEIVLNWLHIFRWCPLTTAKSPF